MKINHFVCPNCNHDFSEDSVQATCDACGYSFHVSQSKQVNRPQQYTFIYPAPVYVPPPVYIPWTPQPSFPAIEFTHTGHIDATAGSACVINNFSGGPFTSHKTVSVH